ncbi:MAG: diguanylate cyclase, partial [Bacteroides sp.]|nr:diguanylate cyclase [Bacteroides sp.]
TLSVTVSIGVSSLTRIEKSIDDEAKHIVKMADEALYTAKASGRNQVVKQE